MRAAIASVAPNDDIFPHGFQWHHSAHAKWGNESLWFSFLAFEPVYKQTTARDTVEKTLAKLGSRSYVIYELTGQYDMLVRAWVPTGAEYEDAMEQVPKVGSVASVHVRDIIHHWVWQETERSRIGGMLCPTEDLGTREPVARELELLNGVQARMRQDGQDVVLTEEEGQCVRDYKSRGLITEPPYEAGIKFVVQVKVADERKQSIDQRDELRDQICEALDASQGVIWDRSLYFCRGHIQFIVLGRVRLATPVDPAVGQSGPFHEITPQLLQKISRSATAGGTKTYTYFFPLPGFLAFKDEISVPPPPAHSKPRFERLFKTEEGHDFEAKGTAFSEVDNWLKGRGEIVTSREPSNTALRSVLFAIASLLNDSGGTLLLGAVESRVYGNYDRAKELRPIGKYLCFGLEPDFEEGHYDDFTRALWDIIGSRIEPSPLRWLKLWPHEVDNKTVAAITVALPDEWFWVRFNKRDAKFVVRKGASATELSGSAITEYQDNHPRRPRRR